jgi:hypothetical protein
MRIVETYSHLNGLEYILVHKPAIWDELVSVLENVNAESCKTKTSREKAKLGVVLYSPIELNLAFKTLLHSHNWRESRTSYWVTKDQQLIKRTLNLTPEQQRAEIEAAGLEPIFSYNQTDFVKDRIAVEIQFGKYAFVAFDVFVKHMAFYVGDVIDVGIEVMPMKELAEEMSSGVAYYERELYNLIRQGRGVPAVPLVLIGVCP